MNTQDAFAKREALTALTFLLGGGAGVLTTMKVLPPTSVTKTVAGPTVTVTTPGPAVTPKSCAQALDAADALQATSTTEETNMATMIAYNEQMLSALSAGDMGAALDAETKISAVTQPSTDTTNFSTYLTASAACRTTVGQ